MNFSSYSFFAFVSALSSPVFATSAVTSDPALPPDTDQTEPTVILLTDAQTQTVTPQRRRGRRLTSVLRQETRTLSQKVNNIDSLLSSLIESLNQAMNSILPMQRQMADIVEQQRQLQDQITELSQRQETQENQIDGLVQNLQILQGTVSWLSYQQKLTTTHLSHTLTVVDGYLLCPESLDRPENQTYADNFFSGDDNVDVQSLNDNDDSSTPSIKDLELIDDTHS